MPQQFSRCSRGNLKCTYILILVQVSVQIHRLGKERSRKERTSSLVFIFLFNNNLVFYSIGNYFLFAVKDIFGQILILSNPISFISLSPCKSLLIVLSVNLEYRALYHGALRRFSI